MSELRTKIDSFILSVSKHINALNAAITGKVNTQTFNNQTLQFQTELYTLTTDLNTTIQTLETFKGLHFAADQASSLISLKNEAGTTITEINVGFLNNEGTKFVYNTTTQKLELRNDVNELLSEIALNTFISKRLAQLLRLFRPKPFRINNVNKKTNKHLYFLKIYLL